MRLSGFESRTKAAFQLLIIHGFAEVTNHSTLQGAVSSRFIRISGDENGRDHVARIDEMSMELNPAHSRHLNISDQARRFGDERRFQELGGRGKRLDRVAQHGHELLHGLTKGLIILDYRYQCTFCHFDSTSLAPWYRSLRMPRCMPVMSATGADKAMPGVLSDGLGARLFA